MDASNPGDPLYPGISRYNSVLNALRNAPARDGRPAFSSLTRNLSAGRCGKARHIGTLDLGEGGKWAGAEGWTEGHVSAFLSDMRAAGVRPDNETYKCAVRCATDAALVDAAKAASLAAAATSSGVAIQGGETTVPEGATTGGSDTKNGQQEDDQRKTVAVVEQRRPGGSNFAPLR